MFRRSEYKDGGVDFPGKLDPPKSLWAAMAPLFSPSLCKSTLVLWAVFFANAFTYYGLVLLTSQVRHS